MYKRQAFDEPKQWEIREINETMNQCIDRWRYFPNPRMFSDVYKRQVHEGAAVRQMEKRGIQTNIGNLNREIRAANRLMKAIRQLIQNLKGWITELGEKRKELLAQKAAEEATLLPNLLMLSLIHIWWMGWRFTTSFWAEKKQETFFRFPARCAAV